MSGSLAIVTVAAACRTSDTDQRWGLRRGDQKFGEPANYVGRRSEWNQEENGPMPTIGGAPAESRAAELSDAGIRRLAWRLTRVDSPAGKD